MKTILSILTFAAFVIAPCALAADGVRLFEGYRQQFGYSLTINALPRRHPGDEYHRWEWTHLNKMTVSVQENIGVVAIRINLDATDDVGVTYHSHVDLSATLGLAGFNWNAAQTLSAPVSFVSKSGNNLVLVTGEDRDDLLSGHVQFQSGNGSFYYHPSVGWECDLPALPVYLQAGFPGDKKTSFNHINFPDHYYTAGNNPLYPIRAQLKDSVGEAYEEWVQKITEWKNKMTPVAEKLTELRTAYDGGKSRYVDGLDNLPPSFATGFQRLPNPNNPKEFTLIAKDDARLVAFIQATLDMYDIYDFSATAWQGVTELAGTAVERKFLVKAGVKFAGLPPSYLTLAAKVAKMRLYENANFRSIDEIRSEAEAYNKARGQAIESLRSMYVRLTALQLRGYLISRAIELSSRSLVEEIASDDRLNSDEKTALRFVVAAYNFVWTR